MDYYEWHTHAAENFPLYVYNVEKAEEFEIVPHVHKEFEFLVMTEGQGIIHIDGKPYEIKKGECAFINTRELHIWTASDNESTGFFAVVFSEQLIGGFGDDLVTNKYVLPVAKGRTAFPIIFRPDTRWQKKVITLLLKLRTTEKKREEGYELKIKSLLLEIWRICFLHSEQRAPTRDAGIENIKKALDFIRKDFQNQLTLEQMASAANMSRGYFCRYFSDVMRVTPFEYLIQIRIRESCRLLISTDMTIGEISQRCGFNSFSYFSRIFRRTMNCTPKEYKRKNERSSYGE